MGNGRGFGKSVAEGSRRAWVRAFAATVLLALAGFTLLGLGSRRGPESAAVNAPASPFLTSSRPSRHAKPSPQAVLGQLPLIFEPNQGQADAGVKFLAHATGYGFFLDAQGAVISLPTERRSQTARSAATEKERFVRMRLVGADGAAVTSGIDPLPGRSNYFIGNDPQKWHRGIPQFAGVRYERVYPGIDLVFYGNQKRLEYDFRVAPGADASQAELEFDGAGNLELSDGDLILENHGDSVLRLQAPQIYQGDGDNRKLVAGRFVLRAGNRVGFEIGPYDRSRELIIDPVLVFSSYFGGSGSVTSPSVAVNGDGFVYMVASTTSSTGFPTAGRTTQLGTTPHIVVTKINPAQPSSVVYETFIGGSGTDTSVGIGVDNGGNVYFAGNTTSTDFPTTGPAYQTSPMTKGAQCTGITCSSLFVSILDGTDVTGATLKYSTYISGNGDDVASAMAIDAQSDVFLTGTTTSNNAASSTAAFPATQAPTPFQAASSASIQFFVTKIDTNISGPSAIAYSTYFGGAGAGSGAIVATGGGITVDSTGNIYFSGTTNFYNSGLGSFGNSGQTTDFPILNAYQPCLDTVPPTVLSNPNPCSNPATTPYPTDAFVAKINPLGATGSQLVFSSYFGGTVTDSGSAIAIDPGAANIYLTGETNSPVFNIPTGSFPFQPCLDTPPTTTICPTTAPTAFDAYIARFNNPSLSTTSTPNDLALGYFTYLGGSGNDNGLAIAADTSTVSGTALQDALVTGTTTSTDFPVTPGAIQSSYGSTATGSNSFYAEINTNATSTANQAGSFVTYFGGSGSDRGTTIAVDPFLNSYFAGDTTSPNLEVENALPASGFVGTSDAFVVKLAPANSLCVTCVAPVLSPTGFVSAGNAISVTFTVSNEGLDPANGIAVIGSVPAGVTFSTATAASGTCSAPANNGVVCTIPTLQAGSSSQVAFNVTPNTSGSYSALISVVNVNNTTTNISTSAGFQASNFSMTVNPASQTVPAGQIADYTVQLNPNPVFASNVSLTVSGLPGGANFSFSNATLTMNSTNQSAGLSITTTPQPVSTVSSGWRRSLYALWLAIPGIGWLGVTGGGKNRGRRRRLLGLLALFVVLGLAVFLPSCSGNKTPPPVSGTPSGTYTLKVTATSGSYSQSQTIQLTVIP